MQIVTVVTLAALPLWAQTGTEPVIEAVLAGEAWLLEEQSDDGAWNKKLDLEASSLAVQALRTLGEVTLEDEQEIGEYSSSDSRELALELLATLDPALVSPLQALRSPDGSYGSTGEDKVALTAIALLAQSQIGLQDSLAASYLGSLQNGDGSWGSDQTAESTALSAYSLLASHNNGNSTDRAIGWLARNQSPEGGWGSIRGDAWALLAFAADGSASESTLDASRYLAAIQNEDGGYGRSRGSESEVSTTGLVLWALAEAGIVFDGATNGIAFLDVERQGRAGWHQEVAAVMDTTTVLDTLDILSRSDASTALSVLWILQRETSNLDFLSRRFGSLSRFGEDASVELGQILGYQLPDGGWGTSEEFGSSVLDTTVALEALDAANFFDTAVLDRAVGFLVSSQAPSGSWGLNPDDDASTWTSALAVQALKRWRRVFELEGAIDSGRHYLESQQGPEGGWGSETTTVWETALVFSALMETDFTPSVAGQGLAYLLGSQEPAGSWEDDALTTALAIRALLDSKPNLRVEDRDIAFSIEGGVEGDQVTVTASVENGGGFPVETVVVRFYLEDPLAGGTQIGGDQVIPILGPGAAASVAVSWDTTGLGGDKNVFVAVDPEDRIDEGNELDNRAVNRFSVSSKPDLVVQDISYLPEFPLIGEAVEFVILLSNIGETEVASASVSFEVGTAGQAGHTSQVLGPFDLGPGSTTPLTFVTPLPEGVFPLNAMADPSDTVEESNESNNSAQSEISMGARMDLVTQAVYLSSRDPFEGEILEIWADAFNAHADDAQNVVVAFYMDGLPGAVPELGRVTIPFLQGGQVITTDRLTWPTMGQAGDHTVYAIIDPDNLVPETDENNNLQTGRFQVSSLPDLVMGSGTIAFHPHSTAQAAVDTVPQGTPVAMRAALSNDGATDAHDVLVRFFDGDPLAGGVQIGSDVRTPLVRFRSGPASTTTAGVFPWITTYVVVNLDTSGMPKGIHQIYGWLDPLGEILEPGVENNLGFSVLRVSDEADLALTSFTSSTPFPEEGDVASFDAMVTNLTETPIERFVMWLHDGNPLVGSSVLIEFAADPRNGGQVPAILGNESRSFSFTLDTNGMVGSHDLHLVADPEELVPELDESNNLATLTFEVVDASTPDFEILREEVTFDPEAAAIGETVVVAATVHNRRRFQASEVPVRFLRVDPVLGEVAIGSDAVIASLGDLESALVEATLDTSGLAAVTPILVKVDPDNVIDERDETNNAASTLLTLRLGDASRPTGLEAVVDLTDVYLTWSDPMDPAVVGYDVLRDGGLAQEGLEEWARRSVASASSTRLHPNGGFLLVDRTAESAIDGDFTTYWLSDGSSEDTWLSLKLPKKVSVAVVTFVWTKPESDYEIQTWDGFVWNTQVEVRGNVDKTAFHPLSVPIDTDRLRIFRAASGSNFEMGLVEVRIHALELVP